jgi:hypothetical protein
MQKITNSSLITGIGYNQLNEELSVSVSKTPNATYVFRGVSRTVADQFVNATSKGSYFNRNIRGRFPSTKVVG